MGQGLSRINVIILRHSIGRVRRLLQAIFGREERERLRATYLALGDFTIPYTLFILSQQLFNMA